MFGHIEKYPGDPILSLMEAYQEDSRNGKVNLSIGLYYDEAGKVPVLRAVAESKRRHEADGMGSSVYLPMGGMPAYCAHVQQLLFSGAPDALRDNRTVTIQTIGGSGALKIGSDFLKSCYPDSKVYVSTPTWENHLSIFKGSGFEVAYYPYYDTDTGGVDFQGMIDCLAGLKAKSIVLLHPCCHNPTGADLTAAQWDKVADVIQRRNLIAFLDMAYQGFATNFEVDGYAISAMVKAGVSFLLSNSFSKIFSLYGERIGGLSVVCTNKEEAQLVLGQLKAAVRRIYSNPPTYGAELVNTVLADVALRNQWLAEVETMRTRMKDVRQQLFEQLIAKGADERRFCFLIKQQGMFSYTGFSPEQVETLRADHAIYILASGRMCIAGLNDTNIDKVAEAFLTVSRVLKEEEYIGC